MTVTLTSCKKQGIKELCMQLLDTPHPTIRFIAQLLGKFTSSFTAVKYGPLYYRNLEM